MSSGVNDRVTYTAVLPLSRPGVEFAAGHLGRYRARLDTRTGRRSLDPLNQAIAALR